MALRKRCSYDNYGCGYKYCYQRLKKETKNTDSDFLKIKFEDKAKNLLDGSLKLMYNLYKNEATVFKVRRSHSLQFKKELKTEAL